MTGLATMLRLTVRRERLRIPVYVLVMAALVASTAAQSEALYPSAADRAAYVETVTGNPGLVALVGEPYDVSDVGGDVAWQWGVFGAVVAALMSMFLVGRHTRGEEQAGRSELVRAAPVDRRAPLVAALLVALAASALMGIGVALVLLAAGEPLAGAAALGAALAGAGVLFAGVAAVAVQLAQTTGGAYGLVGAVLGGAYVLRAAGDVGDGTLTWFSPIGWTEAMRPFAGERWWPLLLIAAATAALVAAGLALLARRDDGAGAIAPRPGPPQASPWIARPAGLALRLARGTVVAWAAGLFLGGLSIGLTAQDAGSIVGDGATANDLFGQAPGSLVDNYLAVSLLSMALIGAGCGLQVLLRSRSEEGDGRLEEVLATALDRPRWLGGYAAVAWAAVVVVLAACGLGTGIADAAESGDAGRVPLLVASSVVLAPAVWVLVGFGVALVGLLPRATVVVWAALGACFLLSFLGPLLSLPSWVMDVSPFAHVPLAPAEDVAAGPLLALTAVALTLTVAGLAAFRRRDVPA